jgi:HrpA-like RNA helicase
VTIIHGMTGCGKSSRLPHMLLEHGEQRGKHTQIMVSQPRRIAATALKNRLSQLLGNKVGLRLGNGIKEESSETRLWFVTTGYLVRLLAHRMESFQRFTHLVVRWEVAYLCKAALDIIIFKQASLQITLLVKI